MAAEVIIELIPDTSQIESALAQIGGSDADTFKKANEELKKQKDLMAATAKEAAGSAASISKIGTNMAKVSTEAVKLGNKLKAGINEGISDALMEAGVSADEFQKALAATGMTVEQYAQSIQEGITATVAAESAEESLRAEKKRLQQEIAKLILAGEQESEMFRQLVTRAGEIDDAMGDASDAIKRTGSDTRGIDNVITAATAVTAGFTVATSAAALFGDESEETQKILLKVNSAMALLNGIQQIQTILRNEDTKSQLAALGMRIKNNAATAIENGLNSSSVVIRKLATAAQWGLNAAMEANPIGIVIVAITALVAAFATFKDSANEAAAAQANLNSQLADSQKGLSAELSAIDRNSKLRAAAMDAEGKQRSEIDRSELAANAAKQAALEAQIENNERVLRQNSKIAAKDEEAGKAQKALADEQLKLQEQLADLKTEAQIAEFGRQKDIREEQNKAHEEAVQQAKDAREKALALLQAQANDRKALAELTLLLATKGTEAELQARIKFIEAERDAQLTADKLTAGQRKLIAAKADKEIADARIAFANQTAKDEATIELLIAQNRVATFKEGSIQYDEARKQELEAQAAIERLSVQQSEASAGEKSQRIILIEANLSKAIADINKARFERQQQDLQRHLDIMNNLEITRLTRKANDPRLSEYQQFKAQQALMTAELNQAEERRAQIWEDGLTGRYQSEQQFKDDLIRNAEEIAQAQQNLQISSWQFTTQAVTQLINAAFDIAKQAADSWFSITNANRQAQLDSDLAAMDARRQKELDTTNITEAQKAAINKKYDAEERALRKRAAEEEKKAKKSQALINGALAVTNIIATRPKFDLGIGDAIMIAAAAATTALQVAQIDRMPTGYAKGTDSATRGWHWVGEEGPELRWFNGGEKVIPHQKSMQLMTDINSRMSLPSTELSNYTIGPDGSMSIDYDRLGKAVADAMPEQTTHVHVDGIKDIIYTRNSRIEYLNNRRSL